MVTLDLFYDRYIYVTKYLGLQGISFDGLAESRHSYLVIFIHKQ